MVAQKKILITGDGGVGKTCLVNNRFQGNNISINKSNTTVMFDFPEQGSEAHNNLLDMDVCIVMYDVTRRASYDNVKLWKQRVKKVCGDIPIIVVGNKIDCCERNVMDNSTINISVKKQTNIGELFKELERVVYPLEHYEL